MLRRQIVPYVVALGAFGTSLGFAVATIKTALIDHPVLRFATSGVTVAGFVELREESQHTDRFVLRVARMEGGRGWPDSQGCQARRFACSSTDEFRFRD
jgi:competence protein ComEC